MGAFSGDLLDQKSKSPLFLGDGGPWLQMTSALGPLQTRHRTDTCIAEILLKKKLNTNTIRIRICEKYTDSPAQVLDPSYQ